MFTEAAQVLTLLFLAGLLLVQVIQLWTNRATQVENRQTLISNAASARQAADHYRESYANEKVRRIQVEQDSQLLIETAKKEGRFSAFVISENGFALLPPDWRSKLYPNHPVGALPAHDPSLDGTKA